MALIDVQSAITNVKTMLSELSAWQTLCGVGTSAEAALRIHRGGVPEDADDTLAPCCKLDLSDQSLTIDLNPRRSSPIMIEMVFQIPVSGADAATPETQYLYAWGKLGVIAAAIAAAVNGAGQLDMTSLVMSQKPGPIDPDENQDRIEWSFTLTLNLRIV